jgi:hypothetical protein
VNKILLITRPNHDPVTTYLYYWSTKVVEEAKLRNIPVLDLAIKKANKKTLESYINKNKPKLIFLNGHGSGEIIAGMDNEPLIEAFDNEVVLSETITYARSCDAARVLGKMAVENGAIAFIGYSRNYIIGYTPSSITRPLNDVIAELFLEPSNLIPISLLKGNTVEDAFNKSQRAMRENLLFMLSDKATQGQKDAAPFMWNNIVGQIVHGDIKGSL